MTNEERKAAAEAARDAMIARIFDLSLELTVERLENVDAKEKKDSMIFDRVARTAQVLVRLAGEADGLAARKRKEKADHDQSGENADEDARIEREAAVIQQRLDRFVDQLARSAAARGVGADGPEIDAGGRNRA